MPVLVAISIGKYFMKNYCTKNNNKIEWILEEDKVIVKKYGERHG